MTISKSKLSSRNAYIRSSFVSSTLQSYGNVNIDNITDDEYEVIKEIEADAKNNKINWKSQSFVAILTTIMANKSPSIKYTANHKGMYIEIRNDDKGKIHIIVKNGFAKKVVVDTFIPFKPMVKYNKRLGSLRAETLYCIYRIARYQVDGELIAS